MLSPITMISDSLPNFATLDYKRQNRTGEPEVVFARGKTPEQTCAILTELMKKNGKALATGVAQECADFLIPRIPVHRHHAGSRTFVAGDAAYEEPFVSNIAVVCAGTSDLPVVEEALVTLHFLGCPAKRMADIGVAGLHRLLERLPELRACRVIIAVAGMEGALPGVIAGLVSCPVIAVPTSTGYGAAAGGWAALLGMLSSCAPGIAVVNIDNGFGAAVMAARIMHGSQSNIAE